MHRSQTKRNRLQIKRIENGISLLQNEEMYLEESTKKTQSH
jgi:flagellin-like hook-associated protein FlgL